MAPRRRKVPDHKPADATESNGSRSTTRRTITDLPPELLHMIFALLDLRMYWVILEYTTICRKIREVAVEYVAFKNPLVDDLEGFLTFMRRHRPSARTVRSLELTRVPLDAVLVSEFPQLFPNLTHLHLTDISCTPPFPYTHQALPTQQLVEQSPSNPDCDSRLVPTLTPMRLEKLTLECAQKGRAGWTLCSMMHILSLFAPQNLFVLLSDAASLKDTFDPSCLAAFPAVEYLQIHHRPTSQKSQAIANVLHALSKTLAPDSLESVATMYDSKPALRALSSLLERVGRNVIDLFVSALPPWVLADRQKWSDPFDDPQLLNISVCKDLEEICISIFVKPEENIKPTEKAQCCVSADLLANYAPPTLEKIVIRLYDIDTATMLENRTALNLQVLNDVVTQARFPNLRRLKLRVEVTRNLEKYEGLYQRDCRDAVLRTLPKVVTNLSVLSIDVRWSSW